MTAMSFPKLMAVCRIVPDQCFPQNLAVSSGVISELQTGSSQRCGRVNSGRMFQTDTGLPVFCELMMVALLKQRVLKSVRSAADSW